MACFDGQVTFAPKRNEYGYLMVERLGNDSPLT